MDLKEWVRSYLIERDVDQTNPHEVWEAYKAEVGAEKAEKWLLDNQDVYGPKACGDQLRYYRRQARVGPYKDVQVGQFRVRWVTDAENTWTMAAAMTGKEWAYVADSYENSAAADLQLASRCRKIAAKVGNKRTDEVLTEDELSAMLRLRLED